MALYTIEVNGIALACNIKEPNVGRMVNAYIEANAPQTVTITARPQE